MRWSKLPDSSPARRLALTLLLVIGGLPAGLAHAQVRTGEGPTPNQFDLSVALGEHYTSNPDFRSDAGSQAGDYSTDFRADLSGNRRSPRTSWSARYQPFYTRYSDNNQFDTLNHSLNFDGRYLLSRRSQITLAERFFYSRNPLQIGTVGPDDEVVILTRQTKRWRTNTNAALDTDLSRSLTLQLGALAQINRFADSALADTGSYSGRVGIQKHLGRDDHLATSYVYSRFYLGTEGIPDAESEGVAESHGVDVAWSHGAPTRTEWRLSAGVAELTRGEDRQNRFTGSASLHHPFRRLDFVSSYRRSLSADAGVANVSLAQNAHAGLSGKIGQRTSLMVLGEYGTRDSVLASGDRLELSYTGGAIRSAIAVNPRLAVSGEARRRKQDVASGTGADLTVDSFFLGLVFRVY